MGSEMCIRDCQSPPFAGAPALETTHPFHFKMNPAILLGPVCNHDLGVLLRIPSCGATQATSEKLIASMLDAMGDNEFYCASYSSKDQPHVEGLLMTLAEGLRAKEEDILKAQKAGETITPHEIARKTLHQLQSSTNRRMHKGFPEMLTYLLNKPMEYCSHMFATVPYDPLYRVIYKLALAHNGIGTR